MINRQRETSKNYPTHRGEAYTQTEAHEGKLEYEDARRALQTPSSATLTPRVVLQLQRNYGNQSVLQLLRDHNLIAQPKHLQPAPAMSRQLIQRDRLIEMQGQKDQKDFASSRSKVEGGLGIQSSGDWMKASFDVGTTEDLFIWGHMTPTDIGGWDFYELAELMIERGFRGCRSIRLIGCNDAGNYNQAPKTLYEELQSQLKVKADKAQMKAKDFAYTLTPIYATKGPLHSGTGHKVNALENWFVKNIEEIEDELEEKLSAVQRYIDEGKQKEPGDFKGRFFENNFSDFFSYALTNSRIHMGGKEIPPSEDQNENDFLVELYRKMMDYKERYFLEDSEYPTLKRPVEGTQTGDKEWNPAAWTQYPS